MLDNFFCSAWFFNATFRIWSYFLSFGNKTTSKGITCLMGIAIWWVCERKYEHASKSWKAYSNPCQLEYSLTYFDDMLEYTLTKVYFAMLAIIHTLSMPCGFATWTPNKKCICSTKCLYINLLRLVHVNGFFYSH